MVMIINLASQVSSMGWMRAGKSKQNTVNPLSAGLTINSPGTAKTETESGSTKNSIYGNFEKEMTRRLNEAAKKNQTEDEAAETSVLVQSLSGAMGEIEQIFGREAATEVMAKILQGTADGVTEDDLLSAIQNGLAGLKRLDPNGTKMKTLTDGFNRDLSLALDQELTDQALESKRTLSLSYALSKHFGSLVSPDMSEKDQASSSDETAVESESTSAPQGRSTEKKYEMLGFDEAGAWNLIEVSQPDEAKEAELREAAEAGLDKATELGMVAFLARTNGDKLFNSLSNFLENDLGDKEAAAFVDKCIADAYFVMENGYGSAPGLAEMLSQVYSKVAADGDADKLAVFEKYINSEFKDTINPMLAEMQQGGEAAMLPGAEVGELQFKGLSGVSLAGESDVFSLNWGYKGNNAYDRSITKRFLQEDIRGVKAVKEKLDAAEQTRMIENWDDSDEEKRLAEAKKSKAQGRAGVGLSKMAESDEAVSPSEDSDIRTTLAERFAEENRQKKLDEMMNTKFGQLSDAAREELEKYLADNFSEEESEKLLGHTKWSTNLMNGLAGIHRDIREAGADDSKLNSFMSFLDGTLKKEVENIASKLDGLSFEGWQTSEHPEGGFEAALKFGSQELIIIDIMAPESTVLDEADSFQAKELSADEILNPALAAKQAEDDQKNQNFIWPLKKYGTGYLVDLLA